MCSCILVHFIAVLCAKLESFTQPGVSLGWMPWPAVPEGPMLKQGRRFGFCRSHPWCRSPRRRRTTLRDCPKPSGVTYSLVWSTDTTTRVRNRLLKFPVDKNPRELSRVIFNVEFQCQPFCQLDLPATWCLNASCYDAPNFNKYCYCPKSLYLEEVTALCLS